jgi:hypothetical protein
VTSFWYPTWLAQPAALVPNSRACWIVRRTTSISRSACGGADYDHVIITPPPRRCATTARWPRRSSATAGHHIGFVGAHAAVLPAETLKASPAIDWVGRKEFDFTCKEVAEGRPLDRGRPVLPRCGERSGTTPERELIADMDALPWVADVYRRDLQIEKYFIGYLLHPYSAFTPGAVARPSAPSASGPKPSAATNTASARRKMSPTKWPT